MGYTLDAYGKPVISKSPTQTVVDMQAVANFANEFANVRHGTAADRGALLPGEMREGMLFSESDSRLLWGWNSSTGWRVHGGPSLFARLAKTTAQSTSATDATWTEVAWSSDASTDGLWSPGTSSRIRLTRPGLWRVSASLRAASTVYARVGMNGTPIQPSEQSSSGYLSVEDFVQCTNPATDYAGIHIAKFSGAAVALVEGFCSARAVFLG